MKTALLRRVANWIDFAVSILAAALLAILVIALWDTVLEGSKFALLRTNHVAVNVVGIVLAGLLFLGAIVRAVQAVRGTNERRYLVFETPGGLVSIRAASVEQAIDRAVAGMDEVADASVVLILPKGAKAPAEARVRCRLYDRPNLLAIQDQVRATVSDRYLEMFPGQEAVPVRVSVERIVFETPGPRPVPPPTPSDGEDEGGDQQPFRPQYPVGD